MNMTDNNLHSIRRRSPYRKFATVSHGQCWVYIISAL